MKIAIDSGPLSSGDSVRGIGVYTRELLKALKMDGVDVSREDLSKYDVVHFTRFNPFFIAIPFVKPENAKFVLTIYDLIPLIYPSHYPPGVKGKINWLINKYLINKNIDAIITISETSKKDICRFLGVKPEIVHVIYLAPRAIFKKQEVIKRYSLPKHFALYVGDVNYNKNIPNLVKACEIARIPLVIAGKQAKEIQSMDLNHSELNHLKNINWSNVVRLGFVPDDDLVNIYNLASVYVQPSLYEGFGLPVLEAIACTTPVVVTKNQCLVEILGDDFKYVNAYNSEDIARGIIKPNINKKLTREYSWEMTAKETIKVYQSF
ncbi:MAG TPA: glycosyltransferase family 1 protein [Patescibacteria group bacterium]|nr:glycosyltransferase family 1 protein [Patescibacteria group bacterium]